jgi:hypothetical protein
MSGLPVVSMLSSSSQPQEEAPKRKKAHARQFTPLPSSELGGQVVMNMGMHQPMQPSPIVPLIPIPNGGPMVISAPQNMRQGMSQGLQPQSAQRAADNSKRLQQQALGSVVGEMEEEAPEAPREKRKDYVGVEKRKLAAKGFEWQHKLRLANAYRNFKATAATPRWWGSRCPG